MTGINQGTPELAVGEPIRLGSNNEYEIEQHTISDRLIIRDTENGKVAYIRRDDGGQIGGDGVLVKALKEGKAMADDGYTYDTIQEAERAADGWVFVPPGTYTEHVEIRTPGLTIKGSGPEATIINAPIGQHAVSIEDDDVTVRDLQVNSNSNADSGDDVITGFNADTPLARNVKITRAERDGFRFESASDPVIVDCTITANVGRHAIHQFGDEGIINNCHVEDPIDLTRSIATNNVVVGSSGNGIQSSGGDRDAIIIGNRVINSSGDGIHIGSSDDCIVANNRISGSGGADINDNGTGTLLDANLTGGSN